MALFDGDDDDFPLKCKICCSEFHQPIRNLRGRADVPCPEGHQVGLLSFEGDLAEARANPRRFYERFKKLHFSG
jgi:hypothetical protein